MIVINKQKLMVVGLQFSTQKDYLYTELPHLWNIFFERNREISNRVDTKFMEITYDVTEKNISKLICIEVNEFENIPDSMTTMEFPEYEYISDIHRGKLSNIDESFSKMAKWANDNGYQASDFKIDYGYHQNEKNPIEHTLLLRVF
jgi:predicted transcriptional regulator YdeE